MYTCPLHQWASHELPCPACQKNNSFTSSDVIINPSLPTQPEKGEAKGMEDELERTGKVIVSKLAWDTAVAAHEDNKRLTEALEGLVKDVRSKPNDTRYATHLKIADAALNYKP